jgi:Raf kinase inhibitor-like YbhB/YbcL family protein
MRRLCDAKKGKLMENQKMSISTDAIIENGAFDPRYTCDIDNSSPDLRWDNAPEGTACFALIAEDLDAPSGIFTHWVIYNIPTSVHHLPAGIPPQESLPNGIKQGLNSYGKLGYAGPCPPLGDRPHRYVFTLYALNQALTLIPRMKKDDLLSAIEPYIIDKVSITGSYQRMIQRAG